MEPNDSEITNLLVLWKEGDDEAMERLMPLIYNELHAIAKHYLKRGGMNRDFSVTDLMNEVWILVRDRRHVDWQDRNHFFADAAKITRHFVIRYYQECRTQKRGEGRRALTLPDMDMLGPTPQPDWTRLEEALGELEKIDKTSALILDLFYFVGLKQDEIVEFLDSSRSAIKRELDFARAWLRTHLQGRTR